MKTRAFFQFYAAVAALAIPVFLWTGNMEFLFYAACIALFIGGLWYTDRFFHYRATSLSLFTVWLVLHILGGVVPIGNGEVLYNWMVLPLVPEPYLVLKFDQAMHAFCYVAIGLLTDDAVAPLLKPGNRAARFTVVALVACGIGALNEVMEFAAVCMIPNTNVGDYTNNALDLVCNTLGALTAATLRLRAPRGPIPLPPAA